MICAEGIYAIETPSNLKALEGFDYIKDMQCILFPASYPMGNNKNKRVFQYGFVEHGDHHLALQVSIPPFVNDFKVTHLQSGLVVGTLPTLKAAAIALERLLKAGDWSGTREELEGGKQLGSRVKAILRELATDTFFEQATLLTAEGLS